MDGSVDTNLSGFIVEDSMDRRQIQAFLNDDDASSLDASTPNPSRAWRDSTRDMEGLNTPDRKQSIFPLRNRRIA